MPLSFKGRALLKRTSLLPQAFLLLCFWLLGFGASAADSAIPEYGYEVVTAFPHDPDAFTQGLFFYKGYLYESTGRYGRSSLRKVDVESGRVIQFQALPSNRFGEGVTNFGDEIFGLTWRSGVGFVWELESFRLRRQFHYEGQGWGLTTDGSYLYMSDGTSEIRVLNPSSLEEVRRIPVQIEGQPVRYLNELEWVEGELFANVWQSDKIARINPATGEVMGWINLEGLSPVRQGLDNVLNGIAYDGKGRLFVTGKLWPKLYEIKLVAP
ncbi:MAG: glutaminyl-peptide cyclotransferase [Kordiimonas sp.]